MDKKQQDLEERFQIAVDKYGDMVYRIAVNQMKSKEDADDVFQEVFIKWMRYCDRFDSEEHEKAWLIRVTINQCKNILMSSWNKNTGELSEEVANTLSYEDEYQEEGEVSAAVRQLPEKYRRVIHLFYYEELSTMEIAKTLGERESTIRTQLTRARRNLAKLLKGVEI